jgi:predicted transcriptional regulator
MERADARLTRLSADAAAAIRHAYLAGATMSSLAADYGVARQTISTLLRRDGIIARPSRSPSASDIARAVALYESGRSLVEIGKEIGFDSKTVWRHLQGRVPMRRPTRRPRSPA